MLKTLLLALALSTSAMAYDLGQAVADNIVVAEKFWNEQKDKAECYGQWQGPKGYKQSGWELKCLRSGKCLAVKTWVKCD